MLPRSDWNLPSMSSMVARIASQLLICTATYKHHALSIEGREHIMPLTMEVSTSWTSHRAAQRPLRLTCQAMRSPTHTLHGKL